METKFIEALNGTADSRFNWGKFMLGRFTLEEWEYRSSVDEFRLIQTRGWTAKHIFVLDLQTGEGAIFLPGGSAKCDLDKHQIWVCPMYLYFLEWLYQQDLTNLESLPDLVDLGKVPGSLSGYRRSGPSAAERAAGCLEESGAG